MNLELVTWDDAWEETSVTSITPRSLSKMMKPYRTETVGWVAKDSEEGVLLISEKWPEGKREAKYLTFIPRGMIVKRQVLVFAESPEIAEQ